MCHCKLESHQTTLQQWGSGSSNKVTLEDNMTLDLDLDCAMSAKEEDLSEQEEHQFVPPKNHESLVCASHVACSIIRAMPDRSSSVALANLTS